MSNMKANYKIITSKSLKHVISGLIISTYLVLNYAAATTYVRWEHLKHDDEYRMQKLSENEKKAKYNSKVRDAFSFILYGNNPPHRSFHQIGDCAFVYSDYPNLIDTPFFYRHFLENPTVIALPQYVDFELVEFKSAEFVSYHPPFHNGYARKDASGMISELNIKCNPGYANICTFHVPDSPFLVVLAETYPGQLDIIMHDRIRVQISSSRARVQKALRDIEEVCDGKKYKY